jgi:hypothetical protein
LSVMHYFPVVFTLDHVHEWRYGVLQIPVLRTGKIVVAVSKLCNVIRYYNVYQWMVQDCEIDVLQSILCPKRSY